MDYPLDRMKRLYDLLSLSRRTRVLDIGSSPLSEPDYQSLSHAGLIEVWGVEPQPEQYQSLMANKRENEHYLDCAIGDGKRHELKICRAPGFTSLLEPSRKTMNYLGKWHRMINVLDRVELDTKRLDELEDLPQFDLLKIDIQGGEVMVFENGLKALSKAMAVMTEVAFIPLYEGQPLLDQQMLALRDLGFMFHKFMFIKSIGLVTAIEGQDKPPHSTQSQAIDGDAVFIRDLLNLDSHSDEALKHLTLLAGPVFKSTDLEYRLLAMLIERGAIFSKQAGGYWDALLSEGRG